MANGSPMISELECRRRPITWIFAVTCLCTASYLLGAWQNTSNALNSNLIPLDESNKIGCPLASASFDLHSLDFQAHHQVGLNESSLSSMKFPACPLKYSEYTPCQDPRRARKFPKAMLVYRERHCPAKNELLRCLIPAPPKYKNPLKWPQSRDYSWYDNIPHRELSIEKAVQNWIQVEGDKFHFPGGGTMFPRGADAYIDDIGALISLTDGSIRTALDTGCGVASWGAYLLKRNVLAMSFAPRDSHEAQVQFALERGVPAVIGVLGSIKLPYPSRAFDMAHCSRCLIPWGANDGMYLMEVDRVLRPGGFWVLSGPPINWKTNYQAWQRTKEDLEQEQKRIEEIADLLCWEKFAEFGETAIWMKKINADSCPGRQDEPRVKICETVTDDVWYKNMEACVSPYPEVNNADEVAGGELKPYPERLYAVPPRISSGSVKGYSAVSYQEDNELWKKHIKVYKKINKLLDTGRYRNIMDMNAGLGSFAAAIESPKLWVMNVLPTIADKSMLGVIYERGLIGIYHDWCEAFSTYPRTYDLIHAAGVFSLYQDKCKMEDILLEMDRILRPEGAVIFRDEVDILLKVKKTIGGMRWSSKLVDHEDGPLIPEKILVAVKQYWVAQGKNSTSEI